MHVNEVSSPSWNLKAATTSMWARWLFFSLLALIGCQGAHYVNVGINQMSIGLDSVFINAYESEDISYPRYVLFNYRIANRSRDTIHINMRRYVFQKVGQDKAYLVFREDTLELFAGVRTREDTYFLPGKEAAFDLNLDPLDVLRMNDKYGVIYSSEQQLLRSIAENSTVCLIWNGSTIKLFFQNRKISFRSPADRSEAEWK
jgi:hypothetical protein